MPIFEAGPHFIEHLRRGIGVARGLVL